MEFFKNFIIFYSKIGRFDSPDHPLYVPDDNLEYKDDWYNAEFNFLENEVQHYWPRLPWHDSYCRIEGPLVKDILFCYEDRWKAYFHSHFLFDSSTLNLDRKFGNFHAQLFRSVVANATTSKCGQNGVQIAFLNAIRRAENFIYIESQYFQGGSNHWSEYTNVGCINRVPLEIAEKICDKIAKNEPFYVYVLLPMFPGYFLN